MGKTLVIKGANFSLNRLKKVENIQLSLYKTENYGYIVFNDATIGNPLTPTSQVGYNGYFVPIDVSELSSWNYKVDSYKSGGTSLLYVAILDSNNNLLIKFPTASSNTVPEVTITEDTLSNYEGTTCTLFICQSTRGGQYPEVKLTKYEL